MHYAGRGRASHRPAQTPHGGCLRARGLTCAHAEIMYPNCRGQHVGQANMCSKKRETRKAAKGRWPPIPQPSSHVWRPQQLEEGEAVTQSPVQNGFSRMDEWEPQGGFVCSFSFFSCAFVPGVMGGRRNSSPILMAGHREVRQRAPSGDRNLVVYIRPPPRSCHDSFRSVRNCMNKLLAHSHHSALLW